MHGESCPRLDVDDVLMTASIQAVRGLPRLHAPGIVPCIISFSRQLPYNRGGGILGSVLYNAFC